jgi:hypothetical protein
MQRRTLLQWLVSAVAVLPFERLQLLAQPRELPPDALAMLREIAPTLLPASLGPARTDETVDRFVAWTRGYREGVPLAHGYGHPRLEKSGPSPVPKYITQLAALDADARAKGGRWQTLDLETRRALLDAAFTKAGVKSLPPRPTGQHVGADLMAFYFRSSEANDLCHGALIQREVSGAARGYRSTQRPRRSRRSDLGIFTELCALRVARRVGGSSCRFMKPTSASSAAASPPRCSRRSSASCVRT